MLWRPSRFGSADVRETRPHEALVDSVDGESTIQAVSQDDVFLGPNAFGDQSDWQDQPPPRTLCCAGVVPMLHPASWMSARWLQAERGQPGMAGKKRDNTTSEICQV
jgi:hypothetical protein